MPTRRACRALTLAFVRRTGGQPLLLPKMTPLGDIDEDDVAFDQIGSEASAPDRDTAGDPGAAAAAAAGEASRPPPCSTALAGPGGAAGGRAGAAVRSGAYERLDIRDLDRLVPDDYARHWQITLGFLQPLAEWWKEHSLPSNASIPPIAAIAC